MKLPYNVNFNIPILTTAPAVWVVNKTSRTWYLHSLSIENVIKKGNVKRGSKYNCMPSRGSLGKSNKTD